MNWEHLLLLVCFTYSISRIVKFLTEANEISLERERVEKERKERQRKVDALYGRSADKE